MTPPNSFYSVIWGAIIESGKNPTMWNSIFTSIKMNVKGVINHFSNLTFKDVVKNSIKQPNQCMTYQNINSLAIDLPTFT